MASVTIRNFFYEINLQNFLLTVWKLKEHRKNIKRDILKYVTGNPQSSKRKGDRVHVYEWQCEGLDLNRRITDSINKFSYQRTIIGLYWSISNKNIWLLHVKPFPYNQGSMRVLNDFFKSSKVFFFFLRRNIFHFMSVEYIIGSNFTAINGGAWIDRFISEYET